MAELDIKQLAQSHMTNVNTIQLATSSNDEPWICTVHFYADEDLNLYWVSRTDRKHSRQIADNPKASATTVIHENTSDEDYVISITLAGKVDLIEGPSPSIREAYQAKLNKPDKLLPDSNDPANLQQFYCLKPERLVLFDTMNLIGNPRQEITL